MARLIKELATAFKTGEDEPECASDMPEGIVEAVRRFAEIAVELEPVEPDVVQFVFDAQWFARVSRMYDPECYRTLILPEGESVAVQLWCFDPSAHLKKALSRVGGAALFSATLTPLSYYAAALGADGDADSAVGLDSPFPRENLFVARVPVAVSMKDRTRSLDAVARIIHAMADARVGNYLACFPSYAYMLQAFRHYRMCWPGDDVVCQDSRMSETERQAFIARFQPAPARSLVAFIVLGGVFAEGVDLPDDRLSGAAIVTTGMPQISFEREQLSQQLDDGDGGGYDAAYVYPGLRRVFQAAGRVIRTETDRGVVLLLDTRYRQEKYRSLMPAHWDVRDIGKLSRLREALNAFWAGTDEN